MAFSLPLDKMTTLEKLQTMEVLWEDLTHKTSDYSSPSWHESILQKRDVAVSEGKEVVYDWDEARNIIRKNIGSR